MTDKQIYVVAKPDEFAEAFMKEVEKAKKKPKVTATKKAGK